MFYYDAARSTAAENAQLAYKDASDVAEKGLAVTHPIRLGLALHYSVFQYEALQQPDGACEKGPRRIRGCRCRAWQCRRGFV